MSSAPADVPTERAEALARLSTEIALVCTADGRVAWADERARLRFGELMGSPLAKAAVPGTETKVAGLLEAAGKGHVRRWELSLVMGGKASTFAFSGEPDAGGVLLVGRLVDGQERLDRAQGELLDSNRALLTLHSVLDDKNDALQRASNVKSRVVANVSHEFRTPINSILGLTQLLLDRLDGDLTPEQEKQVRFVRSSAESLSVLVNDLLDLSRIEAGRYDLRAGRFALTDLFSSLRGMMKPLVREGVSLVVEEPPPLELDTDAGKIAQVLRNLVSNAIKFTPAGEIRVTAKEATSGRAGRVRFEVSDTGIGIAPEDQERIFEEFVQVDGVHQRHVQGTGLGLALSRRLAEVLGGSLTVESALGKGSVFALEVPVVHEEVTTVQEIADRARAIDTDKQQVLVVEDNRQTLFFYERYLSAAGFQVIPARTVDEARQALRRVRPAAIVLDVMLEGEVTWAFLGDLKDDVGTRDIPVMVVTVVDRAQKARALGADEFWLKPVDGDRMIKKLAELSRRSGAAARILVIDDDEAARYVIRRLLDGGPYVVFEASDGASGLEIARTKQPDVILLDFLLEKETAFDVIDDLKADPVTRSIPVIIQTAKMLDEIEREKLERETSSILKKQSLSREVAITRIREALEASSLRTREKSRGGDA